MSTYFLSDLAYVLKGELLSRESRSPPRAVVSLPADKKGGKSVEETAVVHLCCSEIRGQAKDRLRVDVFKE